MLTGSSLLARVRELGACSKSELVRACGYVSSTKDAGERLNYTAFYEALLDAKGIHFGHRASARSSEHLRPGRHLSYTTKVHFNGNLMVGSAYTALLDLKPGDTFTIQIEPPKGERQRGQIRLLPRTAASQAPSPSAEVDLSASAAPAAVRPSRSATPPS